MGAHEPTIVDTGSPKQMDLVVECPAPDFAVAMMQLPDSLRPFKTITILQINGALLAAGALAAMLGSLGFRRDIHQTLRYDMYV